MMRRQHQDQQSRIFYELSSLVLNLLRSPPTPISFSEQLPEMVPAPDSSSAMMRRSPATAKQMTAGGFASLMLGISVALMLCGWVTFFIGFLMMPWVIGLVMIIYVAGIVSTISMLGRSLLCYATATPPPPPKGQISEWKLL